MIIHDSEISRVIYSTTFYSDTLLTKSKAWKLLENHVSQDKFNTSVLKCLAFVTLGSFHYA